MPEDRADDSAGAPARPAAAGASASGRGRDLTRRRTRRYAAPETGRMHHIGGAPEQVPVHTESGVEVTGTAFWQLADRTVAQLRAQHARLTEQMARAAAGLDFEGAARLRDELAAVEAELTGRGEAP